MVKERMVVSIQGFYPDNFTKLKGPNVKQLAVSDLFRSNLAEGKPLGLTSCLCWCPRDCDRLGSSMRKTVQPRRNPFSHAQVGSKICNTMPHYTSTTQIAASSVFPI